MIHADPKIAREVGFKAPISPDRQRGVSPCSMLAFPVPRDALLYGARSNENAANKSVCPHSRAHALSFIATRALRKRSLAV